MKSPKLAPAVCLINVFSLSYICEVAAKILQHITSPENIGLYRAS